MWMNHPDFNNLVNRHWNQNHNPLHVTIREFTHNLSIWNQDTFQNIYAAKKRTLARLGGIKKFFALDTMTNYQS